MFATNIDKDNKMFVLVLKNTLKLTVDQFEENNDKSQMMMEPNEK